MVTAQLLITVSFNDKTVLLNDFTTNNAYFDAARKAKRVGNSIRWYETMNVFANPRLERVDVYSIDMHSGNMFDECWGCERPFKPGDKVVEVNINDVLDSGMEVPHSGVEDSLQHPIVGTGYHRFCLECALKYPLFERNMLVECNPEIVLPIEEEPKMEEKKVHTSKLLMTKALNVAIRQIKAFGPKYGHYDMYAAYTYAPKAYKARIAKIYSTLYGSEAM